jgi:probable rRNA maturation factor
MMTAEPDPAGAVAIDLAIRCARWRRAVPDVERVAGEAARAALGRVRRKLGRAELSLVLADDAMVARLNRRWRGRKGPTNVLAFAADEAPSPPAPRLLGDVVLAYETVMREAKEQSKRPADHLRHLIVHGVLHLLGYDHDKAGPARRMEALETRILAGLGIGDPYRWHENAHG